MKTFFLLLLALSLTLNVALGWRYLNHTSASAPASASSAATAAKAPAAIKAGPVPIRWQAPASEQEMTGLVSDLRGAGFPPSVMRAIVFQSLRERMRENDPRAGLPYWKRNAYTPEMVATYQKMMDEYTRQTEAILGRDGQPSATLSSVDREQRYGNLSDEKLDALSHIERDYNQMNMSAYAERSDNAATQFSTYKKQRDALEAAKMADLAAILSPEELAQYEMRNSDSARTLMRNAQTVDLNESEYAALYAAQKKYDASLPVPLDGNYTSEMMAQRAASQQALNEQARTVLNDDRFYQYLQTADSNYGRVAKFAKAYPDLAPATTYALYQLQTEANNAMMQASQTMRSQSGASPEQRQLEMQTLAAGYETKLLALVGPQVAEAYKKDPAGRAFSSISRMAKPRTGNGN